MARSHQSGLSMPNRSGTFLRILLLSALTLGAPGCAPHWAAETNVRSLSSTVDPGPLRVVTISGQRHILENVSVAHDTLRGTAVGGSGQRVQVPSRDVRSIERRVSPSRRDVWRAVGVVGLTALALIFAFTHQVSP